MVKKEFNYMSSNGSTLIHCIKWVPENPIGVIQIKY